MDTEWYKFLSMYPEGLDEIGSSEELSRLADEYIALLRDPNRAVEYYWGELYHAWRNRKGVTKVADK